MQMGGGRGEGEQGVNYPAQSAAEVKTQLILEEAERCCWFFFFSKENLSKCWVRRTPKLTKKISW